MRSPFARLAGCSYNLVSADGDACVHLHMKELKLKSMGLRLDLSTRTSSGCLWQQIKSNLMQLALNDKRDSWVRVIEGPGAERARRSLLGACSKRWFVRDHAREVSAGGMEAGLEAGLPDLGLVTGNTELLLGAVPEPTQRPRNTERGCDGPGTS